MGKKEGVKQKNPHKTKTLTNQTKGKRIFRLWGAGFHRVGGASDILQGLLLAFPLGGACSSQARWPCRIRVYSGNQSLTVAPPCLSPASPTLDSPCQTADCAAFPSLGPKVSNCERKTCALAPLKVKEKKIVALSPTGLLLPQQRNPCTVTLCAWWPHLWIQLLSSQGEAPTALVHCENGLIIDPIFPTHLKVVKSVFFRWYSVSLGDCSPLQFYFQFGSRRRSLTCPSNLPPSCPFKISNFSMAEDLGVCVWAQKIASFNLMSEYGSILPLFCCIHGYQDQILVPSPYIPQSVTFILFPDIYKLDGCDLSPRICQTLNLLLRKQIARARRYNTLLCQSSPNRFLKWGCQA